MRVWGVSKIHPFTLFCDGVQSYELIFKPPNKSSNK